MLDKSLHWISPPGDKYNEKRERILLRPPAKIEREREQEQLLRLLKEQRQPPPPPSYQNENSSKQDEEKLPFHKSHSLPSFDDVMTNTNMVVEEQPRSQLVVIRKSQEYVIKDRKFEVNGM